MKILLLSGVLSLANLLPVAARTWTDVKGREIEAEYVSQTSDAVVLKLASGKEVTVPIKNLSRADLSYLIDLDIGTPSKEGEKMEKEGEKKEPKEDVGAIAVDVADPAWDKAVPKSAVLKVPLEVREEKKGSLMEFSSPNFRVVADGRLSSKAVEAMLEACELTFIYCESLPFGLANRFTPVEGKYEIHTTGEKDDWVKAGGPEESRSTFNPNTGQLNICLELFGLSSAGRGGDSGMSLLASQMILHVSRCMIPEVYDRNFGDWFKEGLPNLLNMGIYEKGKLDYSEVLSETKDLMLGKGRSGQKAIFKKEITMPKLPDLIEKTIGGEPDEEARRRMLGQGVLLMAYLIFLEDEGKATGLRQGLRYAHDFQKNWPKTIPAANQEEFERKKAELIKKRDEMGATASAMIFRKRPWAEVEADLTKLWGENGLKVVFPGGKE